MMIPKNRLSSGITLYSKPRPQNGHTGPACPIPAMACATYARRGGSGDSQRRGRWCHSIGRRLDVTDLFQVQPRGLCSPTGTDDWQGRCHDARLRARKTPVRSSTRTGTLQWPHAIARGRSRGQPGHSGVASASWRRARRHRCRWSHSTVLRCQRVQGAWWGKRSARLGSSGRERGCLRWRETLHRAAHGSPTRQRRGCRGLVGLRRGNRGARQPRRHPSSACSQL